MSSQDGTKIATAVLGGVVVALLSSIVTAATIGSDHASRTEAQAMVDRSAASMTTHLNLIYARLKSIDENIALIKNPEMNP